MIAIQKTFLLALIILSFSCSKDNCEEKARELTKQYEESVWRAGNSTPAILKLNADYNRKLTEIYSHCN